ncbi:MAG: GntR family transcriptional regulator [Actinobacteria bacterium]|nr:GntR family transcriptional regulator [Actinomycetota bacterium]
MEKSLLINKKLLAEQIYDALKSRILEGKYPTGFRLKESIIAKEFGVSNIPVREALKYLMSQGFINIIPHKGAEVVNFSDPVFIKNIYETRIMIECFCVENTIRNLNPEIINKLKSLLESIKKRAEMGDLEMEQSDYTFHRTIVESAGNSFILNIFNNIHFVSPLATADKAYDKHKKIFDAIIDKDIEKAKNIIKEHLHEQIIIQMST